MGGDLFLLPVEFQLKQFFLHRFEELCVPVAGSGIVRDRWGYPTQAGFAWNLP
jgi:hypothetical protein